MKHSWDIIGILCVALFGAALLALGLSARPVRDQAEQLLEPSAQIQVGEEWIGLYFKDEKVGLTHIEKRTLPGGGHRFEIDTRMHLKAMGRPLQMRSRTQVDLGPDRGLKRFEFEFDAASAKVAGEASVVPAGSDGGFGALALSLEVGGVTRKRTFELSAPPVLQALLGPVLARDPLVPGATQIRTIFDPITQQEQTVTIEVVGPTTLLVMDHQVPVTHIKQTLGGLSLSAWINGRGEVIRQELPLGMLAKRETEEAARWGLAKARNGENAGDMMLASMVAVEGLPDRLKGKRALSVRLTGGALDRFTLDEASGRQHFEAGVFSTRLQSVGAGLPLFPPTAPPQTLAAEPLVEVDDPRIKALAKRIVRGEIDTVAAARRIAGWIHREISQTLVPGAPSALQTLDTREGDCNEHSTLFAALARAIGVPTRVVLGLVYRDGRFGYHAWNEVLTASGWLSIDVSWNQFPVDVGHLRFISGGLSKQIDLLGVIGQLEASEASVR